MGVNETIMRTDVTGPREGPFKEQINHPAYYGGKDDLYECIKVIEAWKLNFNLGSMLRYIRRGGVKDPAKLIEDYKKARWYLTREIETLENKNG